MAWISDLANYVKEIGPLAGIPLMLVGLILLLGGWRLWRVAAVVSFAVLGVYVGSLVGNLYGARLAGAVLGGLLLAAAGLAPQNFAAAGLAGFISGLLSLGLTDALALPAVAVWIIATGFFLAAGALAFINPQMVIILATSLEGAALMLLAATAARSVLPAVYDFMHGRCSKGLMLVFLVLVPTIVGVMLQMADANRKGCEVATD